ncbi:MAG TPA: hypothetical protein VFZ61_03670 [Polyangiales bacterium]
MASTFQVADILADVADLTQSPAFSASTRVTATRATYWLTQSVRALSALLRQHHYDDREMLQTQDLVTVPNLGMVSLPVDCGEVHALLRQVDSEDYELVRGAQQDDLVHVSPKSWAQQAPCWRMEGQTVALYPPPTAAHVLRLYYTVHLPTPLGATIQARIDSDRWLTLDVAAKVATAKGKSTVQFDQQKALVENDFLSRARARDEETVHTIRDTRAERANAWYRQRWGG